MAIKQISYTRAG